MIDFENQLNKEQLAVVKEGDGFCLVLAGAGSGKTRAITYRTAYLLEKGVKPENMLLLTFTNKAANQMISRVKTLTGIQTGFWAGTFHSLANRVLRHYAGHLGFASNFSILDEDDAETILKHCLKDMGLADRANRFPSARIIKSLYSFSRNSQKSLNEVIEMKDPRLLPHLVDIEAVVGQYQKKKQEANAVDFDDLLVFWLRLLAERDDVRQKLAEQFQYILVDEYQDTNRIQAAIIKFLASHHHNLLVVGDDAQSIYSFRAADISNILEFERDYPGAKIFRLETNYRSTPEILDLANEVIRQNIKQFPKNLTSLRESYFKPQVVRHDTPNDEAAFIVKKIAELQASRLIGGQAGFKLQDMAVL
ncbi:MAG: ATP-dependent helicase, partial [Patescibacteria group bacterium]